MTATASVFSNRILIRNLVILYIATCGLYFFYWFYETNKELYKHNGIDTNPLFRTIGLIAPLLNIYLLWVFFKDIQKFTAKAGTPELKYPGWLTVAFIFFSALYRLPFLFSFLGFLSVAPVIVAQNALNAYWKKEQPNLPDKTRLTWQEILCCVVGAILLILACIGAGLHLSPPAS